MKAILKFILSIILIAVAFVLFAVLFLPAVVFSFIYCFRNKNFLMGLMFLSRWLMDLVHSLDQTANVFCRSLFNTTLIQNRSHIKFGDPDETISSVLGRNKRFETLTIVGSIIVCILDFIDKNHSEKSIGT